MVDSSMISLVFCCFLLMIAISKSRVSKIKPCFLIGVQLNVEYPLLKMYALLNISSNILRIIYSLNMGIGGETGWCKF